MNNKRFILISSLLIAVVSILILQNKNVPFRNSDKVSFSGEVFGLAGERNNWSERIVELGESKAYREFKAKYLSRDLPTQHLAAHVFGEILYEKLGLQGIAVCDEVFGFGCYHGLLIRVLNENGLATIPELDKICREKFEISLARWCQHGIGHGIVEYLGYTNDKLLLALEACNKTVELEGRSGCSLGVFMAYNIRPSVTDNEVVIELRKFNPENPYEPCSTVAKTFQKFCYSQLGFWWNMILNGDYQKIGNLCNEISDETNRRMCFFGVGVFAATLSAYDPKETAAKCKNMPNGEGRLSCESGARSSLQPFNENRGLREATNL